MNLIKRIYAAILLSIMLTAMMHSILPHIHHNHDLESKSEIASNSHQPEHSHEHEHGHHHNQALQFLDFLLDVHSHSGHVFYFTEETVTYLNKKQNLVDVFLLDSQNVYISPPIEENQKLSSFIDVVHSEQCIFCKLQRGPPVV